MAKKKVISVIIPSWNAKTLLRQCLESVTNNQESVISGQELITRNREKTITDRQSLIIEVIVIDNGSTDGSPEMVEKMVTSDQWLVASGKKKKRPITNCQPPITLRLIKNKKNLGYGAANNQGMKKAKGDFFLLLNSDTIIKDKAPAKMAQFLEQHPEVGAVGCKLLNPDGTSQPSFGPFPNLLVAGVMLFAEHWLGDLVRQSGDEIQETDWVMGAALMVRKEVVSKAGSMDEGIFMYMDEVEWCYRIKQAGYKVMFCPQPKIIHFGRASSKTGKKDPILNIYRGLLYLYKKHYPHWQLQNMCLMLKLKAVSSLAIGYLINNQYLKETYGQALKIS